MLTVLLVCVAFGLIFTKCYSIHHKNKEIWKALKNMPSPPGVPVLGHMLWLLNSSEKVFLITRKLNLEYYPIYKLSLLHMRTVNLVSPEDIELILSNTKHNSKSDIYRSLHDWLGTGLLTSTGRKWQTRRKILTPTFHFSILQDFLNVFNEETNRLLEEIEENCNADYIDVVPPITQCTLLGIAETAMGLKTNFDDKTRERYIHGINRIGQFVAHRLLRPWMYNNFLYGLTENGKEHKAIIEALHGFTRNVIQERQKQVELAPSSDPPKQQRMAMLDLLLSYQAKGADIDEEGIREEVDTFMFAGHDTTTTSLSYTLMLLANHRKIQDDIFQELTEVLGNTKKSPSFNDLQNLKHMERCIKESLRLYPSAPFISRVTGEEVRTHSGYLIPKDCIVNIYIYDLHRNPKVFHDPEKFDPDRFLPENVKKRHPYSYIPFSAGHRNCIGQKFAILELKAMLCGILREFILEPVDKPEDIVLLMDIILRSKNGVKVKFVKRK